MILYSNMSFLYIHTRQQLPLMNLFLDRQGTTFVNAALSI